jgi:hypothetical protein
MVVVTDTAAEVRHGHAKKPGSERDKPKGTVIKRYPFAKYGRKKAIEKAHKMHYAITKSEERQHDAGSPVGVASVATPVSLRKDHAEQDPLSKQLIGTLWDGTKIFLVDGAAVRSEVSTEFALGGHGLVTHGVPENEIWVEDSEDADINLAHEILEHTLMKYEAYTYDQAHAAATSAEAAIRAMETETEPEFVGLTGGTFENSDKNETDIDQDELETGIQVEMEHTDDPAIAKTIALDHLTEINDYYTRLLAMEHEYAVA